MIPPTTGQQQPAKTLFSTTQICCLHVNKKANDAGDSKMALVDEVTGALNLTRSTYSSESECSVKV
ncbi:hypothetical protein V1477_011001 [Vespula maculifrons]